MKNFFELGLIVAMVVVGVVTAIVVITSSPNTDPVQAKIELFDRGEVFYLDGRSVKDRSGLLWIGEQLADDLSKGNATSEQAQDIETRLDRLLRTVGWLGMSDEDHDRWQRIDIVMDTRKVQQVQTDEIWEKYKSINCGAISAAAVKPDGTSTTGPIEIVCRP